jgi:hypothetical protein
MSDSHLTQPCRHGVLAFGDSITNAGGELQWGFALQSWALWVARATGLAFTSYAFDGSRADDVVREQIPAFRRVAVDPDARYDLGCVYIGVNDVRAPDWDASAFAPRFREALAFLGERCDRTLTMTAPLDLGRPHAGVKVVELNAVIESAARDAGALLVDLSDFGARNHVMPDHVHPTAFGQIAIAERALVVLAGAPDPLETKVLPSTVVTYKTHWLPRLRADLRYTYRHAKVSAAAAAIVALQRLLP